jgi:serine/threonine protein phosphatase PrpC
MTPAPTATVGVIGGASARGSSHIHRNKPNQDARGGWVCGQWSMIAVSDGHGGEPYFRSDRGSRFAVEAVREAFTALSADGAASVADLDRLHGAFLDLPARIVALWRQAVTADIQSDPDPRLLVSDPHVAYGATCIAAAFGPGVSVFAQIGDGDLLAAPAGGDLMKPLPDDEGLEGEQTYSLCHANAVSHFRTKMFGAPHPLATPGFAMVSSDGLSKSFTEDSQFFDIARHWRSLVQENGMQATCADLESWLARCSEKGSGDDNTLMMFYNAAAKPPVAEPATLPELATSGVRAAAPLAHSVAAPATGAAVRSHAPPVPPPPVVATAGFGVGALAAAAVLGAVLGAGVLYFAMKGRQAATPLPQPPVSSPFAPLQSGPQQGDAPTRSPQPGEPEPKKPAQPVELGVPARPGPPVPRGGEHAPAPKGPALPILPREPGK